MNEEQHIQNLRGHMRNISRIPTPYKAREIRIHPKIEHWAVYQVSIWFHEKPRILHQNTSLLQCLSFLRNQGDRNRESGIKL